MCSDISLEFYTATGNILKANRYRNSIGIRIDNGRGPAAATFFVGKDTHMVYMLANFIFGACNKLTWDDIVNGIDKLSLNRINNLKVGDLKSELAINHGRDDHITLTLYDETLIINIRTEDDQAQVVFTKADVGILRDFATFLLQQYRTGGKEDV